MKTRTALLLGSLLSIASASAACGGAVEPVGGGTTSTSGGGSTPPSTNPATPPPVSTTTPPHPTPGPHPPTAGTWDTTANGCGNFTVYASHSSGERFLVVNANKSELGIAQLGDSRTIDLVAKTGGPSTDVHVDTYPSNSGKIQAPYCTDIIIELQPEPTRATAIAGTATFTIAGTGREGDSYAVTVTLQGVVVRAPDGTTEAIPDVTYSTINVGWLPG